MNLQQFRLVLAAIEHGLNLTETAAALSTSQSAVSKQIQNLEAEIGFDIFLRKAKRLTGITEAGEQVVRHIQRAMTEIENIRQISQQRADGDTGRLVIAATHNQATNSLPRAMTEFSLLYPGVSIELLQGTPEQIVKYLIDGAADIAVATEGVDSRPEIAALPCFSWRHVVIAPRGHPLTAGEPGIAQAAAYPLITYGASLTGRANIDAAFKAGDVEPVIRMTAMDADVIKTYVGLGLGLGIVTEMAIDTDRESDIVIVPGSARFFEDCFTKIAVRRGRLMRSFAYRFIELFAPHLDARRVSALLERDRPFTLSAGAIPTWPQWRAVSQQREIRRLMPRRIAGAAKG